MARAFIIMLDSLGVGATADADQYGDAGADTLRHIAECCAQGRADRESVRSGPLMVPHLTRLGLNEIATMSQGTPLPGLRTDVPLTAMYGCAAEKSLGKDTQSGHWEMAGVPVLFEWGYFPANYPSFPQALLDELIATCHLPGVLGNRHASGTHIIAELGEEHQRTGQPIVYTSGDSVFQIAAHEETFGLQRLYTVCQAARRLVDAYCIGRVIARPFLGTPAHYYRTGHRRDYATPPPEPTLLDHLVAAGRTVIAVGKIADIYAHHGISKTIYAHGNRALFSAFLQEADQAPPQSLTFVNLVDFDTLFGHRRDIIGYAQAIEAFDCWLPEIEQQLQPGDLVFITADHGCDPTWPGSDHTREHVPIIVFGPGVSPGSIGRRDTFADIGQSVAKHLGLLPLKHGQAFI